MSKEIVKACVRYNDRLYTGFDHGECFKKLNEDNIIVVYSKIEQGFVDSDGNFVDRKQAMIIAREAGQLRYEPSKKTLISEDLHLNWLNQQDQRIAELEEQLANSISPKFKIGQEVWCVYEYWWNGKFADETNKFAINNFIIDAINIDKYGQYYIFHKEYECRDNIICYQPNFNGNRFNVMCGVQNHYIDDYYLFATKEEAFKKLEELKGEK